MRTAVLKQRSDYTFKFNRDSGRHGWIRLTPAYSLKVVEEILDSSSLATFVLDPFCGTGTTALASIYRSKHATSLDVNPFLVWLARVKCTSFSEREIVNTREIAGEIVQSILKGTAQPAEAPPIHDIDRWWDSNELLFLRLLKGAINISSARDSREGDLLRIAFCRIIIRLSNAAFNHQSMSFKERPKQQLRIIDQRDRFASIFLKELEAILTSAHANPSEEANIMLGDARNPANYTQGPFDLIITSPPYPNRMSYIRELRPYMYWLDYLTEARQAGEMDWGTIGGTWGIATSRLTGWQAPNKNFLVKELTEFLETMSQSKEKNSPLLAAYVCKYFSDIWTHLRAVTQVLSKAAKVNYIVGNSSFYGIVLPVEIIYQKMMESIGFQRVSVTPIRKRNSKKALYEFNVTAVFE